MMKTGALLVCLVVASVSNACAQQPGTTLKGIELYDICNSKEVAIKAGCEMYIDGFMDGFIVGQLLAISYSTYLCFPESGLVSEQAELIVLKAMRDHPELLNQDAKIIVGRGLLDAFRCKPGQTPHYQQ
jgi:hypothetical protein